MNTVPAADAPPSPGPLPTPATRSSSELDIDTRISIVEQRLLARQARLVGRSREVLQRVRRRAGPPALLAAALGAVLAGVGLGWVMRRGGRNAAGAAARHAAAEAEAGGRPLAGLTSLLPLVWPLLPARWRARMSPTTALTLLGLAGPVLDHLLPRRARGGHDRGPGVVAVLRLDPARFAGTWHEQARLPERHERDCTGVPRAHYTPRPGGFTVRNECLGRDGRPQVAEGVARAASAPGARGGELQVTFAPPAWRWLPVVWADLWVLAVDDAAADYRVALVGQPSLRGLWVLSRSEHLPEAELQGLLQQARAMGFDTARLVRSGADAP